MLPALVVALVLQQAAPGQVVWQTPPPPEPVAAEAPAAIPAIPDWARADPYGYERSECSPLIRKADESMEACQVRVRAALAAHLGDDLPVGLAGTSAAEQCRQEAAGDRYALQCGAPSRSGPATSRLVEQVCETRPRARAEGGVTWTEECRPGDGSEPSREGLRIRLGGDDD
ncbi:MAG: hypothetical protein KKG14_08825 [Alphaproteobacteria bacterium]|nr:hypothetical protein [Alphaproteobacteria bacterium]MBU2270394.1 hypothetical protein [Alphaproteobacteria bacterium]MBU2418791.1 hypothetical protein [Alphaproteobacteria bacterium]